MDKTIEISIIITIYNVEDYLKQSLDSILAQTFNSYELICVDDCSEDGSLDIIQAYMNRDKRIKAIHLDVNKGAAYCRNVGLREARGEYVIILDADDVFRPHMIETAYKYIKMYNLDVLKFGYKTFFDDNLPEEIEPLDENPIKITTKDAPEHGMFGKFGHEAYTKLYKREYLIKNDIWFQDLPANNDAFFTTVSLVMAEKVGIIKEYLLYYRFCRPDSITMSRFTKENYCIEKDVEVLRYLKERDISEELYKILYEHMVNELVSIIIKEDWYSEECKENLKQKIRNSQFWEYKLLSPHSYKFINDIKHGRNLKIDFLDYYTGETFLSIYKRYSNKRIAMWGCGQYGRRFLRLAAENKIVFSYVIDKKLCKDNINIDEYTCVDYKDVKDKIDVIFVSSPNIYVDVCNEAHGKILVNLGYEC